MSARTPMAGVLLRRRARRPVALAVGVVGLAYLVGAIAPDDWGWVREPDRLLPLPTEGESLPWALGGGLLLVAVAWGLWRGSRIAWVLGILVAVAAAVAHAAEGGRIAASLPAAGIALLLALTGPCFRVVPRRWAERADPLPPDPRAFALRHGVTGQAPLALLPGNDVVGLAGGRALVGMKCAGGVAVCVGEPVAADGALEPALAGLIDLCERRGQVPALLAASAAAAEAGERLGLERVKIAEDSLLDLPGLSPSGKARAKVRHAVSRAERGGVSVERYSPDRRAPERDEELHAISEAWLAGKTGPEMGFTLGRFDPDRLHEQLTYIALVDDEAVAFVTWLPYLDGRGAVLDLMRRGPDAPPGTMEALIWRGAEHLASEGFTEAGLGGVPLASTTAREGSIERTFGFLYENAGSVYDARGLFAFKMKFAPRVEPLYLLYPSAADLPRIGVAVARVYRG